MFKSTVIYHACMCNIFQMECAQAKSSLTPTHVRMQFSCCRILLFLCIDFLQRIEVIKQEFLIMNKLFSWSFSRSLSPSLALFISALVFVLFIHNIVVGAFRFHFAYIKFECIPPLVVHNTYRPNCNERQALISMSLLHNYVCVKWRRHINFFFSSIAADAYLYRLYT